MDVAILVVITSADVILGLITTAFHVAQRSQGAASLYEPVKHHKTSSAEQPADNFGAVVLNGLLADRE